ncbi:SCAN domain-containing protein 3-like [Rhopalosiphum padi]|uniref:SCAN domain-containing protein 3-like n=1 Tax=Rhopalosiphum padi TaxID=40932 RepID=UPI00298E6996|nr:SCAN domain-containing protein 3-like [Rhopalosiphum padi]
MAPQKIRLYNDDYIKFGFTFIQKDGIQMPQCVICHVVLSNDALRPSRLERHLTTAHPMLKEKPKEFFVAKKNSLNKIKLDRTGEFQQNNEKIIEASYHIAFMVAQQKKPHTLGETLIKPSILKAVEIVLGEESKRKVSQISLSDNTIKRRIDELALDIQNQLIHKLKNSVFFTIQCDESTDVANCCQLLVYCRFINEKTIAEELMFSQALSSTSKGSDVLSAIDIFFDQNGLSWKNVVGVCTDGAPAMLGSRSGFVKLAKDKNPSIIGSHCVIHRQALAAKTLPFEIKNILCSELSAQHSVLLFHTEVRWLSKGNMLERLYELKSEVEIMLLQLGKDDLRENFTDENFTFYFAYLADFFETINNLNLKLQGRNINVIIANDTINSFLEKIQLWKRRVNKETPNFSSFRRLNELLSDEEEPFCPTGLKDIVIKHLDSLTDEFTRYFPNFSNKSWQYMLTSSPFSTNVDTLPDIIQEQAIELKNDSRAKIDFNSGSSLEEFWVKYQPIYPEISNEALKVLVQFSSTYLCESGFSSMAVIKNKHRNRLDVASDLRCSLSNIEPNIKKLSKEKCCQH